MDSKILAVVVTVAFSAVGVLGDYFLKRASLQDYPVKTPSFPAAHVLYAVSAGTVVICSP